MKWAEAFDLRYSPKGPLSFVLYVDLIENVIYMAWLDFCFFGFGGVILIRPYAGGDLQILLTGITTLRPNDFLEFPV